MYFITSNVFVQCLVLFIYTTGWSQEKTFEREYSYKASDLDSKSSCRVIAINQLRNEILNEVGVYIESESVMKTTEIDGEYSQDYVGNIETISAGITKFKVIEEKWDGDLFWMRASITINEDEIIESLKQVVADRQKMKELESLKLQLKAATKEIENLKENHNFKTSGTEKDKEVYNDKINTLDAGNHFLSGSEMSIVEDFEAAIIEYSKVIEIQPKNADAYHNRGIAKAKLKDYQGAVIDFTKTIELDPNHEFGYYNRGNAKDDLNDFKSAIADYNKAIRINSSNSNYLNNRGIAKGHLGDFNGAISDYSEAIKMSPMDSTLYYNRGIAKLKLGQRDSGCKDLYKSKELGFEQAQKSIFKWCN